MPTGVPPAVERAGPSAKARFFYALRPDRGAAEALAALAVRAAQRWGGHAFAAADIHLTLAFVGMRALDERPALAGLLHGLPAPPASPAGLALTRLGSFGHGVLWIAPSAAQDPQWAFAHALAREIRERLTVARIGYDTRALKLHATLVRGARGFDPASVAKADAAASERVVVRDWSLLLGAAGGDPSAGARYRWFRANGVRSERP